MIDAETRHRLGEYYTPDWLAQRMIEQNVADPLNERVLDPACGSGTFLFWAVRHVLATADKEGLSNREALELVVNRVSGIDLHPVVVTLARVTYLLAIGHDRLADRDELTIPVFLGDSVRWDHDTTSSSVMASRSTLAKVWSYSPRIFISLRQFLRSQRASIG